MTDRLRRKWRRIVACILAVLLVFQPFTAGGIPDGLFTLTAAAGDGERVTIYNCYLGGGSDGTGNLLAKGTRITDFYGKDIRTGIWYYRDSTGAPLACINPSKSQRNATPARKYVIDFEDLASGEGVLSGMGTASPLTIKQLETIYYAAEQLGLTPDRFGENGMGQARFIVYQSLVWAVVSGNWTTADDFVDNIHRVTDHLADPSMKSDIHTIVSNYAGMVRAVTADDALPAWGCKYKGLAVKNPQKMTKQEDGTWKAVLPIDSGNWEHNELVFGSADDEDAALPAGWSVAYGTDEITFTYSGTEKPDGTVLCGRFLSGGASIYMRCPSTIEIVVPENGVNQPMIGMAGNNKPWHVYVAFGEGYQERETGFEIFLHEETFHSDYDIEIDKRDHETGKGLENAEFNIYEAFDTSQLDGTVLTEKNKAGAEGIDQFSSPFEKYTPDLSLIDENHSRKKTDGEGRLFHKDAFEYFYSRTYCGGHPEPEPVEISEDATEEEAEAAREADEAVHKAWEAGIAWCEEHTDFHDVEPGIAEEECRRSRDMAYEEFIALKFQYAVKEVKAREGYILHNHHNDDRPIEMIEAESIQAGGVKRVIGYLERDFDETSGIGRILADAKQSVSVRTEKDEAVSVMTQKNPVPEAPGFGYYRQYRNPFFLRTIKASDSIAGRRKATPSQPEKEEMVPYRKTASPGSAVSEKVQRDNVNGGSEGGGVNVSGPFLSSIEPIDQPAHDSGAVLHTFTVYDHRTEGEIHINKRDMEIDEKDPAGSYGATQGDATLEGAVYGLFAAENIHHPDGKSGIVFRAGELVSIASTDKNGDASFLVITEAPEDGPDNFYNKDSNQAGKPDFDYPDLTSLNGNSWIGRPLFLGSYYIRELSRSEGYELSVKGEDNPDSNQGDIPVIVTDTGFVSTEGFYFDENEPESHAKFDVKSENTQNGFDIFISGYPAGTKFYKYISTKDYIEESVLDYCEEIREPKKAAGGESKNDREGKPIYKRDAAGNLIYNMDAPGKLELNYGEWQNRPSFVPDRSVDITEMPSFGLLDYEAEAEESDIDLLKDLMNEMLAARGYRSVDSTLEETVGWKVLPVAGQTNRDMVRELGGWCDENTFWDTISVGDIYQAGSRWFIKLYVDYRLLPSVRALLNPYDQVLYLRAAFYDEQEGLHSFWQEYTEGTYSFDIRTKALFLSPLRGITENVPLNGRIEDYEEILYEAEIERYQPGEQMYYYFPDGDMICHITYRPVYKQQIVVNQEWTLDELTRVDYDDRTGVYKIHVNSQEGEKQGERTDTFLAVTPDKSIIYQGQTMDYGAYLAYLGNGGVSVSPAGNAVLYYPGQFTAASDSGTGDHPVIVRERAIKQTVRVEKEIDQSSYTGTNTYASVHEDWFTRLYGGFYKNGEGASKVPGFRFRAYLKSNLERLFRDREGHVVWQDRKGNEIDIMAAREKFPAASMRIDTKVLHATDPLFKKSEDAAICNDVLYSFSSGKINEEPDEGYTRILEVIPETEKDPETTPKGRHYNYEKFFDGIRTANHDKWVDAAPAYTSGRPVGNEANHKDEASWNALATDAVRQFAIRWYLNYEVEKLVSKGSSGEWEAAGGSGQFQNEIYDRALYQAIKKAEDYLKPFFAYDMDSIYAVSWDSSPSGGSDGNEATLSADTSEEGESGYCFGVSAYLPYGTYVIAEQQPSESVAGDLKNRNYQISKPQEITVPTVYEGHNAAVEDGERNQYYRYSKELSTEEVQNRYLIRFQEEGDIIEAHNHDGDFQVYKYGMALKKIRNGIEDPAAEDYFSLTQSEFRPTKNYYNSRDDRSDGDVPYYLTEGMNGREAVSKYYRYSSVSESGGMGTMQGELTAYEGKYAPMLVPWTVTVPGSEESDGSMSEGGRSSCQGYVHIRFKNKFCSERLRIEKLDSETGENILHDGAIFAVYAADREEKENSRGHVKFYEKDTTINGSKEFLEAMGAGQLTTAARGKPGAGELWTGVVPAGTPICREEEQIVFRDNSGKRTGLFEALSTTRDGLMEGEENPSDLSVQDQNTGYIETPGPLGAGVYVLCEIRPPAGYARSKPIAIEVYSDKVTYYFEGNRNNRVEAAVYGETPACGETACREAASENKGNSAARIYVGNSSVRLKVVKEKTDQEAVTYRTDTRLEGTESELKKLYGSENLEFAYKNGRYSGYAWYKGTLEYLEARKAAGETVSPVYEDGVFAGYGLVTIPRGAGETENLCVPGARLVLYDAIRIRKNGIGGDNGYDGVKVTRDRNGNVQSMQVLEGYAGSTTELIRKEDIAGSLEGIPGNGTWTYQTVQRKNTDILYYSLGNLSVTKKEKDGTVYGYDCSGKRVRVKGRDSVFVLKNGHPEFEIAGTALEAVTYSPSEQCIEGLSPDTRLYHLNSEGSRDALVDPETGMAYLEDQAGVTVWPVKVAKTSYGAVISRDKIKTYRIASFQSDTEQEYTIGTYDGTRLLKEMNPVLNCCGLPVYYQKSEQTYTKGQPVYDIDHDFVRYRYSDFLEAYNRNAFRLNFKGELFDVGGEENLEDDRKLFHRQGEAWITENTWLTGETTPDDPFTTELTSGQPDMLKRVIPGTYIMEELTAPAGYALAFPEAVTVGETNAVQEKKIADETIKAEISKIDAPDQYKISVSSDFQPDSTVVEKKGAYSYKMVPGVHLALYKAKRVYTIDSERYPKGYYLAKTENGPAEWTIAGSGGNPAVTVKAEWITDGSPKYFEGIPAGDYILEELETPAGYLKNSMEIEVKPTGEVQGFELNNDHTKLEIFKYVQDEGGSPAVLPDENAATLALYGAVTDEEGNIIMEGGIPCYDRNRLIEEWTTDDLSDYITQTEKSSKLTDRLKRFLGIGRKQSGFIVEFEKEYRLEGPGFTRFAWETEKGEREAKLLSSAEAGQSDSVVQIWRTDTGKDIRITIYRNVTNGSLDEDGNLPLIFEYQFNYREMENGILSYDTTEGLHRIDYLPFTDTVAGKKMGNYVLVETGVPDGYEAAQPKAVTITEEGVIRRVGLKNEKKHLDILKLVEDEGLSCPAAGAELALYQANADGVYSDEEELLVDSWISGTDGRYTEEDQARGTIPEGLAAGDFKAHRIDKVPDGIYYLVEKNPPDYMAVMDPVRIETGASTAGIYRITNRLLTGRLELKKTGEDTGLPLKEARFRIKNKESGREWYVSTDEEGKGILSALPVGVLKPDGTVEPYTYLIEEVNPPDGYQITEGIRQFSFDTEGEGPVVTYRCEISNQPTEIHFTKTDFESGMIAEGAKLSIYHARALDGKFVKEGEAIGTFVTERPGFTIKKKLSAGHTYILEESDAPAGYAVAEPVVFTVNQKGTGISTVTNDFSMLKLTYDGAGIGSLSVTGRVPTGISAVIKDLDEELPPITIVADDADHILTSAEGIVAGHLYEISEFTRYSDGNNRLTDKTTKRIFLDGAGEYHLKTRSYLCTEESLVDGNGRTLDTWKIDGAGIEHVITNPIREEPWFASVTGISGAGYSAVMNGAVVKYTVAYQNPAETCQDVMIEADLHTGLKYMRSTGGGEERNGIVKWKIENAAPKENGTVELVATVTGEEGTCAEAVFMTQAGETERKNVLTNPIVPGGSVTVRNRLSGTGKNVEDEFTYFIIFRNSRGDILKGYQPYTGSKEGRLKGEGEILLRGNEYVVFEGLPYGTVYEITQKPHEEYALTVSELRGQITQAPQSAVFENTRNDRTDREILSKGGKYAVKETTYFTDGRTLVSGTYRFRLNESGLVDNLDMEDKPVRLYFSKVDIDRDEEISGGRYSLKEEETGKIIYEFEKKGAEKVLIPAELLVPGRSYVFREILPPVGYAWTEEVRFTVNESGLPETVVMQDGRTEVRIVKVDSETGEALSGGRYTINDVESGKKVYEFTAAEEELQLQGILEAGKTYEMVEEEPPAGYSRAEKVIFTVPEESRRIRVVMEDKPTSVVVKKLTEKLTEGGQIPGCILQILNKDGSPARAVRDSDGFKAGENLVFTTEETFRSIRRQLTAGVTYFLHEKEPGPGYAFAEDVPFTVSNYGSEDVVIMFDKPTRAVISKKSLTGEAELPGNLLSVLMEDGTIVEEWLSEDEPHEIIAKLIAGKTYFLHEECPAPGYTYAEDVAFTVSPDGSTDLVEMRNRPTEIRILKKSSNGTLLEGAVLEILDGDKNPVETITTTGEAFVITGKLVAGKTYYLHEAKAPSGYLKAADVPFTVPASGGILEVTMVDERRNDREEKEKKMFLKKTDAKTGEGLEAVEFTVFSQEGKRLFSVETGEDGYARFEMPEDGIYLYRETKTIEGYFLSDETYTFTIENGRVLDSGSVVVADQRVPEKTASIGRITASYKINPQKGVKGTVYERKRGGEKTGDGHQVLPELALILLCLAGLTVKDREKRKKRRKG